MAAVARVFTVFVFALAIPFWIIYLSGVAATQSKCVSLGNAAADAADAGAFGAGGALVGTQGSCSNLLGFTWWSVFLQLFVIVLHVFLALSASPRITNFTMAMTAISTVLLMTASNTANQYIYAMAGVSGGTPGQLKSALQASMAGSVVLSITNIVYMFLLGDAGLFPSVRNDSAPAAAPVAPQFRASKAGDVEMPAPAPARYAQAPLPA